MSPPAGHHPADDDTARVTPRMWEVHVGKVGELEDRVDGFEGRLSEHDAGMRQMVAVTVEAIMQRMPAVAEEGAERALRKLSNDPAWWRDNVRQIAQHAADMSSAWVGGRILLLLVGGALAWGIAWLVRNGNLKL